MGIGTETSKCHLQVNEIGCINNGSNYATDNNCRLSGSATIGGPNENYGTTTGWTGNTAGLMMECDKYTEIVVRD